MTSVVIATSTSSGEKTKRHFPLPLYYHCLGGIVARDGTRERRKMTPQLMYMTCVLGWRRDTTRAYTTPRPYQLHAMKFRYVWPPLEAGRLPQPPAPGFRRGRNLRCAQPGTHWRSPPRGHVRSLRVRRKNARTRFWNGFWPCFFTLFLSKKRGGIRMQMDSFVSGAEAKSPTLLTKFLHRNHSRKQSARRCAKLGAGSQGCWTSGRHLMSN